MDLSMTVSGSIQMLVLLIKTTNAAITLLFYRSVTAPVNDDSQPLDNE